MLMFKYVLNSLNVMFKLYGLVTPRFLEVIRGDNTNSFGSVIRGNNTNTEFK